jgi:Lysyl oxidase
MQHSTRTRRSAALAAAWLTAAALALTGATPALAQRAAGARPGAAQAPAGPRLALVAAQRRVTAYRYGRYVYVDPGIYVAAFGSAFRLNVSRVSYTRPIMVEQVIHLPGGGTVRRRLPRSVLRGFAGLRGFLRFRMVNRHGTTVEFHRLTFCPNGYSPQRATPNSARNDPYPQGCGSFDPFPKGDVWGLPRGWGVDPFYGYFERGQKLPLGTYTVTEAISRRYVRMFHVSPRGAKARVRVKVVKGGGPVPVPGRGALAGRGGPARPLPALPRAPLLRHPPRSALPDLIPLPSWGISTSHLRRTKHRFGSDRLNFGATVWIGGHGPLDVEGFRVSGTPTMRAYQYFYRRGHVIGRARVGTMGFAGYNHWHFRQFARYRLLTASKKLAVRSHKEGFCIAPTDSVDLLLPHATWLPYEVGLEGACGEQSALWVTEELPLGWGDTYFQSVPGESFNITHLPNGAYYIEVIANPEHLLYETNMRNDISLRKVILGGTKGHRTVRVPPWHGLNPEK